MDPEKGSSEMAVPKSGGFLLTGKGCPRQSLHTDFGVGKSRNGNLEYARNPGYFFMCSGENRFPLWVCPFSHYFTVKDSIAQRHMSMGVQVKKVHVPPNSVFIGRGDLSHAGASYEDSISSGATSQIGLGSAKNDGHVVRYHL